MSKFWIVTKQVYKKNVRSGSWLFLVVSPIIMGAVILGITFLMGKTASDVHLAVASDNPAAVQVIKQSDKDMKVKTYKTVAAADKSLDDEKADAVLAVTTTKSGALHAKLTNRIGGTSVDSDTLHTALNQLNMQMAAQRLSLGANQLATLLAPVKMHTKSVTIKDGKRVARKDTTDVANRGIAMGITIMMLLVMMTYGSILAQEIATEKGSRIMEMLLSSVSATTQFFGKIVGVMLLLLTQIAVYAVAVGAGWTWISRQHQIMAVIKQVDLSALGSWSGVSIVLYFIFGTLTYAVLAALVGSLVANQEQVQQAVLPISMFGMIGYFGALMAQGGDSLVVKVLSYIPFINVSVMPVRATMGYTKAFESPLGLLESAVFLLVFTYFAARVYRANVLVYSEGSIGKALRKTFTMMGAQRHSKQ